MVEGLTDGAEGSLPAVDAAALERGLAEPVHAAGQRNADVTVSSFPGDKSCQVLVKAIRVIYWKVSGTNPSLG